MMRFHLSTLLITVIMLAVVGYLNSIPHYPARLATAYGFPFPFLIDYNDITQLEGQEGLLLDLYYWRKITPGKNIYFLNWFNVLLDVLSCVVPTVLFAVAAEYLSRIRKSSEAN